MDNDIVDKIIKEKSCGGVVFLKKDKGIQYLVEKMGYGHFSMPKGHIEKDETKIDTALREIKEETGLNVCYVPGFRHKITYSPQVGHTKDVFFFAFRTWSDKVTPQKGEVEEIYFLPYEQAYEKLTFDTDKETLQFANEFIKNFAF